MQIPGPWPRWLLSVSLRARQKNLHFNKLPFDPNIHSSLKAMLLELFVRRAEHHLGGLVKNMDTWPLSMEIPSPWLWIEMEGKGF